MDFVYSEDMIKYSNGAFSRHFRWHVPAIICEEQGVHAGYIVQHIKRDTIETNMPVEDNSALRHDYWEAWPVKDGEIDLPDYGYHDWWMFGFCHLHSNPDHVFDDMLTLYMKRLQTRGKTIMQGNVYWAPEGGLLCDIVNSQFNRNTVDWAKELQATYNIKGNFDEKCVFSHVIESSWDLENEEKAIREIVDYLRRENSINDENKRSVINKVFGDSMISKQIVESFTIEEKKTDAIHHNSQLEEIKGGRKKCPA